MTMIVDCRPRLPTGTVCSSSSTVTTVESDDSSSDREVEPVEPERSVPKSPRKSRKKDTTTRRSSLGCGREANTEQRRRSKSPKFARRGSLQCANNCPPTPNLRAHLRKAKSEKATITAVNNEDASITFPSTNEDKNGKDRRSDLRKTRSCLAIPGIKKSGRRGQLRKERSVHFDCDKDGKVQHEERESHGGVDPSLWWNTNEMKFIRETCFDIVQRARSNGLEGLHSGEVRGLERYIVTRGKNTVEIYRSLVLEAQKNRSFFDEIVTQDAVKVSRAAQRRAQRMGKHDTTEALKATLTTWRHKKPVIVD